MNRSSYCFYRKTTGARKKFLYDCFAAPFRARTGFFSENKLGTLAQSYFFVILLFKPTRD